MYFRIYRIWKKCLGKSLKGPASEDPLTSNMVNGPKHCWNLNNSTFTVFIAHGESNSVRKGFSLWYAKYYNFLLIYWLLITSILLKEAIYCNISGCNYLRNEKYFLSFFLYFPNFNSILNIFENKMTLIADVFLNLRAPKKMLR